MKEKEQIVVSFVLQKKDLDEPQSHRPFCTSSPPPPPCRSNLKTALVGKYWSDADNHNDSYEHIAIVNPLENDRDDLAMVQFLRASGDAIVDTTGFIHPQHNLQERTYDVMLMKLARPSTKRPVKVNFDPDLPVKRDGNEM